MSQSILRLGAGMSTLPDNTSLGPVTLRVRNLARMLHFYTERLGLTVFAEAAGTATLGAGMTPLVVLNERPTFRRYTGTTGLYHFALLLPDRAALGAALQHLIDTQTPLQGASDHAVSEAVYLADPEQNGIELYRDRPRDAWRFANGALHMTTEPLDIAGVLADGAAHRWQGMPPGTRMGHMHLHVGDLAAAERFYTGVVGLTLMARYGDSASFVSAGGYHHHLGLNTWAGRGAPAPGDDALGLDHWQLQLPDAASLDALRARLATAGAPDTATDDGWLTRDPSGNGLLLSP